MKRQRQLLFTAAFLVTSLFGSPSPSIANVDNAPMTEETHREENKNLVDVFETSDGRILAFDTKTTEIQLIRQNITKILPGIGKLTQLTFLNLPDNQIAEIPNEIGHLKQLDWINLPMNRILIFRMHLENASI